MLEKNEYLQAWSIFHQVINVIQPDICIFHGISSHHHMQYYFESQNIDFEWRDVEENNEKSKINGATPILASIDNKTKVLFCKHPSIRYTVELWRNFIFQNFPELNIIQG